MLYVDTGKNNNWLQADGKQKTVFPPQKIELDLNIFFYVLDIEKVSL